MGRSSKPFSADKQNFRRLATEAASLVADHLESLDGLPVGQRPQAGIFEGDRFLHPDLDFQIRFPARWRTNNSAQSVGALAPGRDAMIYLMADQPEGDTDWPLLTPPEVISRQLAIALSDFCLMLLNSNEFV